MKTIQLVVGAMVALMMTACGPGIPDNPTPIEISTPEISHVMQTQATATFTVTGDAERVTGVSCETVDNVPTKCGEELDALTADGTTYSYIAGARKPLLSDMDYVFMARAYDSNGKAIEQPVRFRTKPEEQPIDEKWEFLLNSGLQGHIKQVPPVGKENDPLYNYDGELTLGENPAFGKMIGPFSGAGRQTFHHETLRIAGAVAGVAYPCNSSVLARWTDEVQHEVDVFNSEHGSCRPEVTWRIELNNGFNDFYERFD